MGIIKYIIIITIIIVVSLFVAWVIINWKKLREPIPSGKPVENLLDKFTENKRMGAFIKKVPVGKNKDYFRVHYYVKDKNENNETELVEKCIVVKQNYLVETPHKILILPRNINDLNDSEYNYKIYAEMIKERNSFDLIAKASIEGQKKYDNTFIKGYGGVISEAEILKLATLYKQLQNQNTTTEPNKDDK